MTVIDHAKGIWGISLCSWGLLYLCAQYTIKKFIVDRYENETDLMETAFFENHVPFVKYLPGMLSAGFYGTHLNMCLWGWSFFGKRKVFKDIDDPATVVGHFSKKEIWKVKWVFICGMILFAHGVAYYCFRYIWPEIFN